MSVTELQKQEATFKILKAGRHLFTRAKKSRIPRIYTAYVLAIGSPLALFMMPEEYRPTYKTVFAIAGPVYAFITYFLYNYEKKCIKQAAEIQELFDTKVYELEWNSIMVSEKPSPGTIHELSKKYKGSIDLSWHGDLSSIPPPFDALVAQHNTLEMDWNLRTKYVNFVTTVLIVLFIAQVVIARCCFKTLDDALLTLLLPSISAYILGMKERREHLDNINGRKTAQRKVGQYIEEMLNTGKEPEKKKIRQFQDVIYTLRKSPAVVPDLAYKSIRKFLGDNNQAFIEHFATEIQSRKNTITEEKNT